MIDFGAWANEEFSLPVEESSLTEEDIERIERAVKDRKDSDDDIV